MNMALIPEGERGAPQVVNAFTVDVEDYFQVEAFKSVIDSSAWESWPPRVEQSTDLILTLLKASGVRATFFVLGWIADRFPHVVRRIAAEGHEIASHGFAHQRASVQSRAEFRDDIRRAKAVLEDLCGVSIHGYRAPTFSLTPADLWAYEILAEAGYRYSSSVYPIAHDLYGAPDAPRVPFRPFVNNEFLEIPLATVRLLDRNRPCAGGGYFRLLPYAISKWSIHRVNRMDGVPCVFYCHPWEFDSRQPRVPGVSLKSKVRHYLNLGAMELRVARLLRDFAWGTMDEVFLGSREIAKM